MPGKTFFWSGIYSADMNDRTTLRTDLNVFADFSPKLPPAYAEQPYLFLGNIQPELQAQVQASDETASFRRRRHDELLDPELSRGTSRDHSELGFSADQRQ